MGRLFVVGTLNVDTVVAVDRHPLPGETVMGGDPRQLWGGKGANQAISAARNTGVDTAFVGRVGDDRAGEEYRSRLDSFGIDTQNLHATPGVPTGSAAIAVSSNSENTIIVSSGANARLDVSDLEVLGDLAPGDVVAATLEVPLPVIAQAAQRATAAGARFVLNFSPVIELPRGVVEAADPVIVNEHEARELNRQFGMLKSLLITRGAKGSEWDGIFVPARSGLDVVDTTGAGDAYCGALAGELAKGSTRTEAMRVATNAAADVVQRLGAQ